MNTRKWFLIRVYLWAFVVKVVPADVEKLPDYSGLGFATVASGMRWRGSLQDRDQTPATTETPSFSANVAG
jgi:hypothetical protein